MARANWIDDESNPALDAHVAQLEHFTSSIADGTVDMNELQKQEQNLVTALRAAEAGLSDEQHGKVTKALAELVAYTVMKMFHEMAAAKAGAAVRPKA
jgi:predicted transcriptional regulator